MANNPVAPAAVDITTFFPLFILQKSTNP